jgi:hypothetical protein
MTSPSEPTEGKDRGLTVCVLSRPKPTPPITADVLMRAIMAARRGIIPPDPPEPEKRSPDWAPKDDLPF